MAQTDPPAIAAIRRYLDAVETGPILTFQELARAVDALVMAVHDAPVGGPTDADDTPPRRDYKADYHRLGERFNLLGYYAVASPLVVNPLEALVGDAIDDLADISGDLREVLWRYETKCADDAHWHFHWLFLIHWGQHARELSLYLHALVRAADEGR